MAAFSPRYSFVELIQYSAFDRVKFTLPQETYKSWCMLASQNGDYEFAVAGHRGVCGPGEFVLCPPGVALHRRMLAPLTFHFVLFRWVDAKRKALRIKGSALAGKWAAADWQDAQRIMRQLAALERATTPPALDRRLHLLETLIRQAWYDHREQREPRPSGDGARGGAEPRPVDAMAHRAARILEARAGEPLRVQDVARELRTDRIGLSRRFARAFGMPPIEYLTALRLERARNLLSTTDLKLEDIAEQCGFANAPYLSRLFRKKLHRTPSSYRERPRAV